MNNDYELKFALKNIERSLQEIARIMRDKENKAFREDHEKTQRSLDRYNLAIGCIWGLAIMSVIGFIAMHIWLPR